MNDKLNETSLDTITGALCEIMGIEPPNGAKEGNEALISYAKNVFGGEKADRIFMYNPDAIAQWIYEKYPCLFTETVKRTDIAVPLLSPMPSVTPVCFATMYTGTQPESHGIRKYEKPVLKVDTIFDAMIRAGKKCAIVAHTGCTVSSIFLEREMDYFSYDTQEEVHARVAELIIEDKYDFIAIHACNYDTLMHKNGTESLTSLSEIKVNTAFYAMFDALIKKHWKNHNVFMGYGMDHGCHEIDAGAGSHGLDMPEDLNITHFYKAYKKE
ncbi:MAG: alkaline phosphatase family protein [Clostridia bacterium]|nr:alkaline phosphatase family protein [Clostridia bacterium]